MEGAFLAGIDLSLGKARSALRFVRRFMLHLGLSLND
jgi:hypothetical protein